MPFANTTPSVPAISTASSAPNEPSTPTTPARRSDASCSTSAARAVVDDDVSRPRKRDAIQSLRAESRRGAGGKTVPTPPVPVTASPRTPGRAAAAITTRTPDQEAMRAAASFAAMPPLPSGSTGSARRGLERRVDRPHLLDERGVRRAPGVGVVEALGVGEQHEQLRADEIGDECRDAVVVPEADLVVGDRVVLVHDRDHPELEESPQRRPGLQVLAAVAEVERREQDLARDEALGTERVVVDAHQAVLTDRRERLQRGRVARTPAGRPDRRHPRGAPRPRRR